MSVTFKGIVSKFIGAAKAVKAAILKAAEEAPAIATAVEKDAPEIQDLLEVFFPGAVAAEESAVEVFELVLDAIEAAGPAASANGISVSLDKTLVAKCQAVLPALKAFAAKL
jgi:hypothetical protein